MCEQFTLHSVSCERNVKTYLHTNLGWVTECIELYPLESRLNYVS